MAAPKARTFSAAVLPVPRHRHGRRRGVLVVGQSQLVARLPRAAFGRGCRRALRPARKAGGPWTRDGYGKPELSAALARSVRGDNARLHLVRRLLRLRRAHNVPMMCEGPKNRWLGAKRASATHHSASLGVERYVRHRVKLSLWGSRQGAAVSAHTPASAPAPRRPTRPPLRQFARSPHEEGRGRPRNGQNLESRASHVSATRALGGLGWAGVQRRRS